MNTTQAHKKICPMALSAGGSRLQLTCVSSECMAWRWDGPAGGPHPTKDRRRHGHCGLAGNEVAK